MNLCDKYIFLCFQKHNYPPCYIKGEDELFKKKIHRVYTSELPTKYVLRFKLIYSNSYLQSKITKNNYI